MPSAEARVGFAKKPRTLKNLGDPRNTAIVGTVVEGAGVVEAGKWGRRTAEYRDSHGNVVRVKTVGRSRNATRRALEKAMSPQTGYTLRVGIETNPDGSSEVVRDRGEKLVEVSRTSPYFGYDGSDTQYYTSSLVLQRPGDIDRPFSVRVSEPYDQYYGYHNSLDIFPHNILPTARAAITTDAEGGIIRKETGEPQPSAASDHLLPQEDVVFRT